MMRISIREKESGKRIWLWFPNALLFNSLTARIAAKAIRESVEDSPTAEQMTALFSAMKTGKQLLHGEPLVEVYEHDGDEVVVWL